MTIKELLRLKDEAMKSAQSRADRMSELVTKLSKIPFSGKDRDLIGSKLDASKTALEELALAISNGTVS